MLPVYSIVKSTHLYSWQVSTAYWLPAGRHQAGQGLRIGLPASWEHWSLPSQCTSALDLDASPFSVRKPQQATKVLHRYIPFCFLPPVWLQAFTEPLA